MQECFRSASPFLDGHDLVLQAEQDNDNALINAVMASTPQHPLWKMVIEKMMERAKTIDGINSIFSATGPQLLSEVYANFTASQHLLGQVTSCIPASCMTLVVCTYTGGMYHIAKEFRKCYRSRWDGLR